MRCLWSNTRGNSYTPSPVLYDDKLYTLTDNGMLSCYNSHTGAPYYQLKRLPKPYSFKSSPVGANGKLYLASEDGDVVVVKMGEQFEVLATNTLSDQFVVSTPAIVDGEMFFCEGRIRCSVFPRSTEVSELGPLMTAELPEKTCYDSKQGDQMRYCIAALLVLSLTGTGMSQNPFEPETNIGCVERLRMPAYPALDRQTQVEATITASVLLSPKADGPTTGHDAVQI